MLDALDITEEEAQGLAELARHDLALARSFAARAQAAEDGEEASRLARSYQRAARSYRQTLALKARLKRDLAAAAQVQASTPRRKPGGAAVARRIGELRTALTRLVWSEAERPETEDEEVDFADVAQAFGWWRAEVAGIVSEACLKDDFCDAPLDDHVARLALDLGLPPETIARWRDLPDPPQAALDFDPQDPDWRSSA
ncbi:hypothetical protein [uncultured Phenylobacterium sp.]|uniref:hypothetical protein n=1 Tax=uncultured Phenylobacterium sp. TaxID=349273 RepID=UPI0025E41B8C|nr:hypothetical protein [uncultured Phenylobacterium sp.]